MEPHIINTKTQHRQVLAEVERLAKEDPPRDSADGDKLELLAKLFEDYEKERFHFARPSASSAIRFRAAERGLCR